MSAADNLANRFIQERRQSKTLILSTNVDQKSLETEFLTAICRPTGDKWQSKTLLLVILIRVRRLLDCSRLPPIWCEIRLYLRI